MVAVYRASVHTAALLVALLVASVFGEKGNNRTEGVDTNQTPVPSNSMTSLPPAQAPAPPPPSPAFAPITQAPAPTKQLLNPTQTLTPKTPNPSPTPAPTAMSVPITIPQPCKSATLTIEPNIIKCTCDDGVHWNNQPTISAQDIELKIVSSGNESSLETLTVDQAPVANPNQATPPAAMMNVRTKASLFNTLAVNDPLNAPTNTNSAAGSSTDQPATTSTVSSATPPTTSIVAPTSIPTVTFSSFAEFKSLSSLSIFRIRFSDPVVNLTIPDSVTKLTIDSTNAKDVSLKVKNSSIQNVVITNNPLTSVPKLLYERTYSTHITAIVTIPNKNEVVLTAEELIRLKANLNLTASSGFDFGNCTTNSTSSSDRFKVCTPTMQRSSGSPIATIVSVIAAIAVVAVVIGAVMFRRMRNGKSNAHSDNAVRLINKDDASWDNDLSFISSDESLRALRLEQHEVTLSKSLGAGPLWLGELAGAKVVVKRIEAEVSDAYVTKNLKSQAQALAPLQHENVVSLLGVTWLNGTDFALVAEFMDKSSLKQVLADTNWQLDLHTKLRMCADIAQGLAYLHATERGLYVRAFSSRKVLVNSSSECKLNVLDVYPTATKFETVESYGVGEIAWLAPELLTRSSPQDPRKINMYAFGIVMGEILARAAPYQSLAEEKGNALSDLEIVQRIRRQDPLAPHENRTEYMRAPQSLRDAVERCLSLAPHHRPSAIDVIKAINAAMAELAATRLLL